jgi:hypothetical protein
VGRERITTGRSNIVKQVDWQGQQKGCSKVLAAVLISTPASWQSSHQHQAVLRLHSTAGSSQKPSQSGVLWHQG